MDAILATVARENAERRLSAQNWSMGVYWFAGVAMLFHTYVLSAVVAWSTPSRLVSALPNADDVRHATVYWLYPLLLLNFLITAGTGMSGWAVVGVVYTLTTFGFAARGQWLVSQRKSKRNTVGSGPLLNADGSLAREQEVLERELLKQFVATHADPSAIELRVARMLARYNPDKLSTVDEMLANYAHTEERLLVDLKRKYGPEPGGLSTDRDSLRRQVTTSWRRAPFPMAATQLASVLISVLLMLACLGGCLCIVYLWPISEYKIAKLENGVVTAIPEFQPDMTAKALQLMYAWPRLASDLRLQFYVAQLTTYCGNEFRKYLDVDARQVIKAEWIDLYNINMSDYDPPEWWKYSSVNAWFIRNLAPGARPVAFPTRDEVIVSPADSRVLIFPNVTQATKLWIKGGQFSWRSMMDYEQVDGDPDYFEGGSIVVARLAPQDYHRFHSPVHGRVKTVRAKSGTFWSVNADAVLSENDAFLNQRQIVVIDSGGNSGMVGFIAVGATCVGSVVLQTRNDTGSQPNRTDLELESVVRKGSEIGFMQFGGSTIVLLFRRGAFVPRCDLLHSSTFPVETYTRMGEALGAFSGDTLYAGIGDRCVHL